MVPYDSQNKLTSRPLVYLFVVCIVVVGENIVDGGENVVGGGENVVGGGENVGDVVVVVVDYRYA